MYSRSGPPLDPLDEPSWMGSCAAVARAVCTMGRPSRAPRTQRAPSHGHALRTHHQHHARQLPVAVAVAVAVYIYKIVKTLQVENV